LHWNFDGQSKVVMCILHVSGLYDKVWSAAAYRVPTPAKSSKVLDFSAKISRPWKVLENEFSPGKSWKLRPRAGSRAVSK